jgi:hypothetical protein
MQHTQHIHLLLYLQSIVPLGVEVNNTAVSEHTQQIQLILRCFGKDTASLHPMRDTCYVP